MVSLLLNKPWRRARDAVPGPAYDAVVLVGGSSADNAADAFEAELIGRLALNTTAPTARGLLVVRVGLCGLGEPGGGTAAFPLLPDHNTPYDSGTGDYNLDMAVLYLGRSHVGVHAGDVLRALRFVKARRDVGRVSVVSYNDTASAVLHAAASHAEEFSALGGGVALVGSIATYASIAGARHYRMEHYMGMHGTLAAYDLPDLAAAALAPGKVPLLVASPRDGLRRPLPDPATLERVYAVAVEEYARAGAESALSLVQGGTPSPEGLAAVVEKWLFNLLSKKKSK
jgi:hypothetical protein